MTKFAANRYFFKLTTVVLPAFSFSTGSNAVRGKAPNSTHRLFPLQHYPFLILMLIFCLLSMTGCKPGKQQPPAPLGDLATLEKLAKSYEAASASIPTNPVKMKPQARRKFLEQVFNNTGYDYSRTLLALANINPQSITKHHSDLRELLFLPHYGIKLEDAKDIYSDEELQAIEQVSQLFN